MDKELLLYLHNQNSAIMDTIMANITQKYSWIPLYMILIYALIREFGWQSVYSIVAIVILVIISDQLVSSLMKPFFGRLRPCHDPDIGHLINIVTRCGGKYSFVSGHATNSFSVSTFFLLIFVRQYKFAWLVLIWPILFSYSRIYLGVHYPLDVICGAMLGIVLGYLMFRITQKASVKIPFAFVSNEKTGSS